MDFSTYVRNAILSWIKGTTFPTAPSNFYIAWYSSDPGRTGTSGTDITTSVRAAGRLAIAASGWTAISASGDARKIENSAGLTLLLVLLRLIALFRVQVIRSLLVI